MSSALANSSHSAFSCGRHATRAVSSALFFSPSSASRLPSCLCSSSSGCGQPCGDRGPARCWWRLLRDRDLAGVSQYSGRCRRRRWAACPDRSRRLPAPRRHGGKLVARGDYRRFPFRGVHALNGLDLRRASRIRGHRRRHIHIAPGTSTGTSRDALFLQRSAGMNSPLMEIWAGFLGFLCRVPDWRMGAAAYGRQREPDVPTRPDSSHGPLSPGRPQISSVPTIPAPAFLGPCQGGMRICQISFREFPHLNGSPDSGLRRGSRGEQAGGCGEEPALLCARRPYERSQVPVVRVGPPRHTVPRPDREQRDGSRHRSG